MIAVVHRFVETLHISDEDLTLPLLGCVLRVGVVIQKERKLHATSIDDALVAFSRLILASSVTEDSEGQDRRANGIEASALFTWQRSYTGGQRLDLGVGHVLHDVELVVEVLHGRLDDAALTADGLVAETVEGEVHSVDRRLVVDDVVLQVPQHVQVGVLEDVKVKIVVHGGDPARVNSEEEAKLLGKVALFDVGA